jgi:hypothetical protein
MQAAGQVSQLAKTCGFIGIFRPSGLAGLEAGALLAILQAGGAR